MMKLSVIINSGREKNKVKLKDYSLNKIFS